MSYHDGLPTDRPPVAEQLVSFLAPTSFEADQYRTLRHTVERLHRDAGLHVLATTSPAQGDGKTITTLNLAGALAQSGGARILLIDADLRRPSVGRYLPLENDDGRGLTDVISSDGYGLMDTVHRLDALNLSVLPAGRCHTGSYELLNSPRVDVVLKEARRQFDYVLIDTPPVVPFTDARLLARWVDGFFVVVAAHKTPRKLVAEALNLLDPGKVIGVIFNGDDRPQRAHSGYYGYYSYRPDSERSASRASHWWRRSALAGPKRP
jgi:capsular exopolysaccharide synthesis family protein